jgi:micrococcal nuclease
MNKSRSLRRKIILAILAIALAMALLLYFQRTAQSELAGPYTVQYVIDGDTIAVDMGQEYAVRVRLIGVDAPESADHDETKNTSEGAIASDYMKELLGGRSVWLEYDRELKDQYGRTLAYVYLDPADRDSMAEKKLLSEGYAKVLIISPNDRHEKELRAIENAARRDGKGFWGTGFFR